MTDDMLDAHLEEALAANDWDGTWATCREIGLRQPARHNVVDLDAFRLARARCGPVVAD